MFRPGGRRGSTPLLLPSLAILGILLPALGARMDSAEGHVLPPIRMEVRIDGPRGETDGWRTVEIGTWQNQFESTFRSVPSSGTYRIPIRVSPEDIARTWHVSAGIVGNESEIFLNDRLLGSWRGRGYYDPLPQRTLHISPVPTGVLVAGTNWLTVRFVNRVGGGGILEGPVGLVESAAVPGLMAKNSSRLAAMRGGLEATTLLCGLAGILMGRVWRVPVAVAGGMTFLCLSILSGMHSDWLPSPPPEWFRNLVVLLLPVLMVRFSREAASSLPKLERLHFVAGILCAVIAFTSTHRTSVHLGAMGLFGVATVLVIAAQYRSAAGRLRTAGRVLRATLLFLLAGAGFQLALRRHAFIPWSAMVWDPMMLASAVFVGANLLALILEMHQLRRERERLHQRLLQAEVFHRREMGARLHDEVLQDLIYLKLRADDLSDGTATEVRMSTAGTIATGLGGAIRYLRHMMEDLQPIESQGRSLETALNALEKQIRSRYGLATDFHVALGEPPPAPRVAETLYRAAQESVLNACKHARCRLVELRLEGRRDGFVLTVTDDGLGFDPERSITSNHGLGFLRDRIAWMDGGLSIESAEGRGTRIRIRVPRTLPKDIP